MSLGPPGPQDPVGGNDASSKSERKRERFTKKAYKEDAKSKKRYEKSIKRVEKQNRKKK